jgi:hypothetical protein
MGAEHRSRTRLDRCDRLAGIAEVGGPHGAGDENSVNGIMHGDAVWVVRHVDALHRRVHSRVADDHLVRAHTGEIPSPSRSPPLATACGKALIQVGCRGHGLFRATCVLWNASGLAEAGTGAPRQHAIVRITRAHGTRHSSHFGNRRSGLAPLRRRAEPLAGSDGLVRGRLAI